ncbi:hypothetical protein [Aurantimonas sp. 22II-16-19i]|uniref:hypothetical protein n=1 Tax=Aurantimonas sp. 22II-16-19i TaxID=1317114 RepID=UPI0009F7B3AD|nr:hypothetical protein [Aurantimonas sp. 22II-16-19i]ORE90289.1 hypothetical protein ATO4_21947 [Aurantimonas sp. 22II-16-19i]
MRFLGGLFRDVLFEIWVAAACICAFIAFNLMADRGFSTLLCLSGAAATLVVFGSLYALARRR